MAKNRHQHEDAPAPASPPAVEPSLTIGFPSKGVSFTVPARYFEGHTLSANEAKALNGLLAENLRNNFSKRLEAGLEAGKSQGELQDEFSAYTEQYTFASGIRAARVVADPVEREARKIASQKIEEALRSKGKAKKDLAEGIFDKLVGQLIASDPRISEEARRRVEATQSIGSEALGLEGLFDSAPAA
jgi:hypothetical protein